MKRNNYPCSEAVDDLESFFRKHISIDSDLKRFLNILEDFRKEGRVSYRFIQSELMEYRKINSDYFSFSDDERQMFDDLSYFWG